MLFGTYQSGGATELGLNVTDVRRGDSYTMMDGTETVVSGSASVHFAAGPGVGGVVNSSFFVQGCSAGSTWAIQGSNGLSIADTPGSPTSTLVRFAATFQELNGTRTVGNGAVTDVGAATWYRFILITLVGSDAPVVIVRRS